MADPRSINGQSQFNSALPAIPQGGAPPQPVIIRQTSGINVFMMGSGRSTVNFGMYPSAQPPMTSQNGLSWNPMGMAPQQELQQQQQRAPGVSGRTVPQAGSAVDFRRDRLSPGAAIHPNKLAGQDVRRRVVFSSPPPNGNSPARSQGTNDEGYASGSPADIIRFYDNLDP